MRIEFLFVCTAKYVLKAKLREPTGQRLLQRQDATKNFSIEPILFLYYEESLVSSNLNSKQLRFHGAHPNEDTYRNLGEVGQVMNEWNCMQSTKISF